MIERMREQCVEYISKIGKELMMMIFPMIERMREQCVEYISKIGKELMLMMAADADDGFERKTKIS